MNDTSLEKLKKLFNVFKIAVTEEQKAQTMYKKARDICEDELTRKVLDGLYNDEVRHEKEIMMRYNALRKKLAQE